MDSLTRTHANVGIVAFLAGFLILCMVLPVTARTANSDIHVEIDEAALVNLEKPATDVIIGNPSIADVSVQNGKLLVVTGKSFGVTNLIVVDQRGKQILNKNISVGIDDTRYLTVHKGRNRASYHCSPSCQTALVPGDATEHFEGMSKELRNKFGIAQSAVDGGQAPQ